MKIGKKQRLSAFSYYACDECRKCSECCPVWIDIPKMLEIYWKCKCGNVQELYRIEERNTYETPIDCIECGACSAHCSNEFPVMGMIRELAMLQCRVGRQCRKD